MTWQELQAPSVICDNLGQMQNTLAGYKGMNPGRLVEEVLPPMYQMPLRR
jgi:hypothetical protein